MSTPSFDGSAACRRTPGAPRMVRTGAASSGVAPRPGPAPDDSSADLSADLSAGSPQHVTSDAGVASHRRDGSDGATWSRSTISRASHSARAGGSATLPAGAADSAAPTSEVSVTAPERPPTKTRRQQASGARS